MPISQRLGERVCGAVGCVCACGWVGWIFQSLLASIREYAHAYTQAHRYQDTLAETLASAQYARFVLMPGWRTKWICRARRVRCDELSARDWCWWLVFLSSGLFCASLPPPLWIAYGVVGCVFVRTRIFTTTATRNFPNTTTQQSVIKRERKRVRERKKEREWVLGKEKERKRTCIWLMPMREYTIMQYSTTATNKCSNSVSYAQHYQHRLRVSVRRCHSDSWDTYMALVHTGEHKVEQEWRERKQWRLPHRAG